MQDIIKQIAVCVERGRVNVNSSFPPDLRGQPGVFELVREALEAGLDPGEILSGGLAAGIANTCRRLKDEKVFVSDVLMAVKALTAGTDQLAHLYLSGKLKHKGTFIIGTVYSSSVSPYSSRFAYGSERSPIDDFEKDLISAVMNNAINLEKEVSYERLLFAVEGSSCAITDEKDYRKGIVLGVMRGISYDCIDMGGNVTSESLSKAVKGHPGAIVGLNAIKVVSPRRHWG